MPAAILYALGGAALAFPLALLLLRRGRGDPNVLLVQQQMQAQMQQELQAMRQEMARSLGESTSQGREHLALFSQQLNERMKETSATLQSTQSSVGQRLDHATAVVGQLHQKLGAFEASSKKIFELGEGLREIQDILKNPKLRGNMGEFFLEDLLRQILPTEHFRIQHAFRSGEVVDAVIHLGELKVSVDSKFPLESFVRLLQTPDTEPEAKRRERKAFLATIKKHADQIARKYILPDEGTFDFALMYIPAENIYYEAIIREEALEDEGALYSYLLSKKVIPVSPNSLYAYLQVIVLGLRGLKVQDHARKLTQDLQRLEGDLTKFREEFGTLGRHLKNASGCYEEGSKRLDRFGGHLGRLTELDEQVALPQERESSASKSL